MPGWHVLTEGPRTRGELNVVGIIQEQHPDRARLFMQWKEMTWHLLVDSLNLLGVRGAPITLFLDEAGVIQAINPRREALAEFLQRSPATELPQVEARPRRAELLAERGLSVMESADRQYLWGDLAGVTSAIRQYQELLDVKPAQGKTAFRLGVAFRRRYDSAARQSEDFAKAVASWGRALDLDPNQYIWRRRIQQYGPRLAKPYSFYDWVNKARSEIRARGGQPALLTVEPGGAEFAYPKSAFEISPDGGENPDPEGRIYRDRDGLVKIEVLAVPGTSGDVARVHVVMRPDETRKVHWNNEVEDLILWVDAGEGMDVDQRRHAVQIPGTPVSVEERRVEFEVRFSGDSPEEESEIKGYALYYICEDVNGQCLYRRQDFNLSVKALASETE